MADSVQVAGVLIVIPAWTPFAAVGVAGLSGATFAARRGFDVVGVVGLSIATGLGGLLLRDILLEQGTPVVLSNPMYLAVAAVTAVVGFLFAGLIARLTSVVVVLDGLAMGFLCTLGAAKTINVGLSASSAVFVGVVTAVGGLLLRDVLSGTAPQIVRPGSFLVFPALVATIAYVVLVSWDSANDAVAQLAAMLIALGLRAGAYWRGWHTATAAEMSDQVWGFWYHSKKKVKKVIGAEPHTGTHEFDTSGIDRDFIGRTSGRPPITLTAPEDTGPVKKQPPEDLP